MSEKIRVERKKAKIRMFFKSLIFSILSVFVLNSAIFAQDRNWRTFSPPNKSWSILSPGMMIPDAEAQNSQSGKGSYSYTDLNGFFAVIYTNLGLVLSKGGHYRKQRDMVVRANEGVLLKDQEFTNGKIKGREVYVKIPDKRVISPESNIKRADRVQRFRMFFKDGKFYILLAVLPEVDIDKTEITNYFTSFVFSK